MKFKNHLWIFFLLVVPLFIAPLTAHSEVTCSTNLEGKSDTELGVALKKCEEEIAQQNILLQKKQRESVTIERDIDILGSKINRARAEIRSKEIKIYKLKTSISSKKETVSELDAKSKRMLASMSGLIKKTNELDNFSLVEAMLSKNSLSNFFEDLDDFDVLKGDLRDHLVAIKQIKEKTMTAQEILEEQQKKETALKLVKEAEKRRSQNYREENKQLLSISKAKEDEYKKIIAEKERIKNKIRNRMFRTVGGTEMRFADALKLIQPYEEKIGIEAALVLAVLTQESAVDGVIGSNLGKCTYNQPARNKSGTVMSNSQKPSFLALMKELRMNPNTTPVSCPIYGDGNYGGAMGPSQFMPKTWFDIKTGYGYKKRVAKVLGIKKPSPFINLDAFVGTASYLSDARSKCSGPNGFRNKFKIWSCTAAKYYAGLSASGSVLARHMTSKWSYGYKVAKRAVQFQKDIDTLDL